MQHFKFGGHEIQQRGRPQHAITRLLRGIDAAEADPAEKRQLDRIDVSLWNDG